MSAAAAGVRVAGCGIVSPLGHTLAAFDEGLFTGRSALQPFVLHLPGNDAAQLSVGRCDFDASGIVSPSRLPLDRGSAMALAAARAAWQDAALQVADLPLERLGVFWGSGMGGASTFDATCLAVYAEHRRIRPSSVVTGMPNAPLAELAVHFGARGMALGFACACASAAVAIGEAMRALREDRIDVAIAGGSEALLSPGVIGAWQAMRVLAPPRGDGMSACRPFAADRAGFALGEGAAAFVLEAPRHAARRGAAARPTLSGYATNCDGLHITQPDAAGQARAMQAALADAGLDANDIGHVNTHGTATQAGDAAEADSLSRVFGPRMPPATATKAAIGHLLGAGGGVELLASLCALAHRGAPPTAHASPLDAALSIDLVQGSARSLPGLRHVMSNSFAFGGTNAVLIVSQAT